MQGSLPLVGSSLSLSHTHTHTHTPPHTHAHARRDHCNEVLSSGRGMGGVAEELVALEEEEGLDHLDLAPIIAE